MKNKSITSVREFYDGLSPLGRTAMWVLLALELVLIAATQRDISRRQAAEIRGPKLLWRAVGTQNFVGPAAYLALGRRRSR